MKSLLVIAIALFSATLVSCSKSNNVSIKCDDLITDTAGTNDEARLFVPNAFSPNGDGKNDLFYPIGWHLASIGVKVYENNRVVFSTQILNEPWTPVVSPNTYKKYQYQVQAVTLANNKISSCGDLYVASCLPPNSNLSLYRFAAQLTQNGFTNPTTEVPATNACR